MPLRMLLGDGDPTVAAQTGLRPVSAERVVLTGARDLDPAEVEYLATSPIRRAPVAEAPIPDGPLYVHIDMDVIDPTALPGLRYPAPGGPDMATAREAVQRLLATGRVAALSLVCTWDWSGDGTGAARPFIDPLLADFAKRLSD